MLPPATENPLSLHHLALEKSRESANDKMVWIGKGLKDHPVPALSTVPGCSKPSPTLLEASGKVSEQPSPVLRHSELPRSPDSPWDSQRLKGLSVLF